MDLESKKGISYRPDALFYGASSIKAPYIASVVWLHPGALDRFKDEIQETLQTSDDACYKDVLAAYGAEPMRQFCADAGARASIATSLPWASYSPRDLALMWGRAWVLWRWHHPSDVLGSWSQAPTVSTIHDALGASWVTRSKAGYIDAEGETHPAINGGKPIFRVSNDAGVVYAANGPYVVAIMSNVPADLSALDELTLAIDAAHAEM